MSKPCGSGDTPMARRAATEHALIRGDLLDERSVAMGAGLRPRSKDLDWPPDPKTPAARLGAASGVIEQKSADGIVGIIPVPGGVPKART